MSRSPNSTSDSLTALKNAAFEDSEMVPTYGDEAYFSVGERRRHGRCLPGPVLDRGRVAGVLRTRRRDRDHRVGASRGSRAQPSSTSSSGSSVRTVVAGRLDPQIAQVDVGERVGQERRVGRVPTGRHPHHSRAAARAASRRPRPIARRRAPRRRRGSPAAAAGARRPRPAGPGRRAPRSSAAVRWA